MPEVFITNREIVGAPTEVFVDQYGTFHIYDAEDEDQSRSLGHGDTLDAAVAKARTELNRRRVEVNVEFVTVRGARGVATKRHAKNHTVMARVDGQSEQLDPSTKVFKPDTPADVVTQYMDGQEKQRKLAEQLRGIANTHVVSLYKLVDDAVKEAMEASDQVPTP